MKRITLTLCAATMLLFACNSGSDDKAKADSTGTTKPEVKGEDKWVPVDTATMNKAMMDYANIGPMQQMLASWNGTWTSETTWWPAEGAPPVKSNGTAVNSMVMGGRYQMSKHNGTMMGGPFEGMSTVGYDNASKQFVSTWIDSWGTGIMLMTGPWDAATKTMSLSGTMPDICRPGKTCTLRETFKVIDDNTQKLEMYGPDPNTGKEMKVMEITLTRKK